MRALNNTKFGFYLSIAAVVVTVGTLTIVLFETAMKLYFGFILLFA